jgi:serine/threonine protein kinase
MYKKLIRPFCKGYNEVKNLEKVMDHKNIINIHKYDYINFSDDTIGISIEVEKHNNGDLMDVLIKKNIELNQDEKYNILKDIFSAVEYCHKNNIAHLDIKCENVLLKDKKTPLLIDFGSSRIIHDIEKKHAYSCNNLGTDGYCAPEICSNLYYTSKSDVWSLACLSFTLFTEKNPPKCIDARVNPYILQKEIVENKEKFPLHYLNTLYFMASPSVNKRPFMCEILKDI